MSASYSSARAAAAAPWPASAHRWVTGSTVSGMTSTQSSPQGPAADPPPDRPDAPRDPPGPPGDHPAGPRDPPDPPGDHPGGPPDPPDPPGDQPPGPPDPPHPPGDQPPRPPDPPDPPGDQPPGPPDPPGARRTRAGSLPAGLQLPDRLRPRLVRLIDGVLGYVLGCTALAVVPGQRCIVTDHRLLQLSWTRDAYHQALLLLAARHLEPRAPVVVAEHLRWLWFRCDRAEGWMRSHLPNGAIKDRAFQADQQLYPVLELLDYREATGTWPEAPPGHAGWREVVAEVWRALPIDPELGLVTGEENPADDPASLPCLLSTQILLWHTATRLRAHAGELGLVAQALAEAADAVRAAIRDRFGLPRPVRRPVGIRDRRPGTGSPLPRRQ